MNMIRIAAIGLAVALAGCAYEQNMAQMKAGLASCNQTAPGGQGHAVERMRCITTVMEAHTQKNAGEALLRAEMMSLAARFDAGQITEVEAELELRRTMFEIYGSQPSGRLPAAW